MAVQCGSSRGIGAQVGNTSRSDGHTSPILPSLASLLFIAIGGHPLFDTILRSPNADRASPTSANQRRIPYSRPQRLSYPSTPTPDLPGRHHRRTCRSAPPGALRPPPRGQCAAAQSCHHGVPVLNSFIYGTPSVIFLLI
jgi:hypothetical protein